MGDSPLYLGWGGGGRWVVTGGAGRDGSSVASRRLGHSKTYLLINFAFNYLVLPYFEKWPVAMARLLPQDFLGAPKRFVLYKFSF